MVKMPGKNNKPPRVRKRSNAASNNNNDNSVDMENDTAHNDDLSRSLDMNNSSMVSRMPDQASHYPPTYREDGQPGNMTMGGYGSMSHMQIPPQPHHAPGQNGMGVMGSSSAQTAPPMQFHPPPPKPVMENGYNHVASAVEKDIYSRTLEHNAQIVLQIQQAMAENRTEVVNDLMAQLGKNIQFLSQAAAATDSTPATPNSSSPQTAAAPSPTTIFSGSSGESQASLPASSQTGPLARGISQSPLPVRPQSQNTPPHVSPPPGQPTFPPLSNGQPYGSPTGGPTASPGVGYGAYPGPPQQARPLPVYSPLTQSTSQGGVGYSPKSPNVASASFPPANGFLPSRPAYQPSSGGSPTTSNFHPQQNQRSPPGQIPQPTSSLSNSMPPPQNYPYPGASRSIPSYAPGQPNFGYQSQQESQPDPGYTSMPPPLMQPKRSGSGGHRAAAPQIPPGSAPDGRQMLYQSRPPYLDPYSQSQQPQLPHPLQSGQQAPPQQHYGPGPTPGQQQPQHNPLMSHGSNAGPAGQYYLQSMAPTSHQSGQFRSPAPPGSPYSSPSPGGPGS